MHPLLRSPRGDLRATLVRLLAYVGGAAALAVIAAGMVEQNIAHIPMAAERAFKPDWIVVERPYPAFALSMTELPEADFGYAIHRHSQGNGRKDILSWGAVDSITPRTMIEIYRPGTEQPRFAKATDELAARLPAGTIYGAPEVAPTKFGPAAFVPFTLRGGAPLVQCLGFVRGVDDPRLQLAGWRCGDDGETVERTFVTCALDRLMLLSAASDPKIGQLFARAELKRDFCGRKPVPLATTIKHRNWPANDDPKRARAAAQ